MAIGDSVPYPAGDGQGERGRGTPHFSNLFVKSQPRGIRVGRSSTADCRAAGCLDIPAV